MTPRARRGGRQRGTAAAAGVFLALAAGLAQAGAPALHELLDADAAVRAARAEVQQAAGLPSDEAELARKIVDAIGDGDAALTQLAELQRQRDAAPPDESRQRMNDVLQATLEEARPRVCIMALSFVRRSVGRVRSETLLIPTRRARSALDQACALLQGRPAPGTAGAAN